MMHELTLLVSRTLMAHPGTQSVYTVFWVVSQRQLAPRVRADQADSLSEPLQCERWFLPHSLSANYTDAHS